MYELLLRTDIQYEKLDVTELFSHSFKLYYYNDGEFIRVFLDSKADPKILQQYFSLRQAVFDPFSFQYWTEITLNRESDFYHKIHYNSFDNFLGNLKKGQAFGIFINLDRTISRLFSKKAHQLERKQNSDSMIQRQLLENYARDLLYTVRLVILDNDPDEMFDTAKKLTQFILTNSNTLKIRKMCNFNICKPMRVTYPPKLKLFLSFEDFEFDNNYAVIRNSDYKLTLWATKDDLYFIIRFPKTLKIPLGISVNLPYYKLNRKHEICIGKDLLYMEEVCLEPIDFIGHAFIFGASRSGKSNTLEVIAKQLKDHGIVIFVDPNSQSARKLSQLADLYFSITKEKPNFGLNILQLPHIFEDRKKNIDYQIANVLELFDKLLNLTETAVNVRYILQVLLYQMYKLTDNVTFQDVYNAVIDLYNGTLDLDVDDEQFQKEVEMLQKMQPQSFFSILTRIKMLVENDTFKVITSETTLDWDKVIPQLKKGLIVFDVGKSAGEIVSQVVQMMIALSLFYYVFRRDQKGEEKIPIYFIVDEAQNIAHFTFLGDILAESAKYALHLILATQSYVRLMEMAGEGNARGLMANTNLKLVMRIVEGHDASEIARSAGLNDFVEIFPKLSRGQGFLTIGGKPGELSAIKFVQIDYSGLEDKENKLTTGFEPKPKPQQNITTMLNPILQLIEKRPNPLELIILYKLFKNGKKMYMPDLLRELGIDRDKVEDTINKLASTGMVDVTKEGNKKAILYVKGLFPLKHIVTNEEGRKIALRAIKKYYEKGYIIVPGKQEGNIRPDFLALKYDTNYRVKYNNVIAVEIESPNELSVHQEQVSRNMRKYAELPSVARDRISEIHIWTSEDAYPKLEEVYKKFLEDNTIDENYKKKVRIFAIKTKKNKQNNEITEEQTENPSKNIMTITNKPETTNHETTTNETTINNNEYEKTNIEENKPEPIQLMNITINVLGKENNKYIVEINGTKYYINKEDFSYLQSAVKDHELIKNISLEDYQIKINLGAITHIINLTPL